MLHVYQTEMSKINRDTAGWVKRVISEETGISEEEITYEYGKHGKPRLTDKLLERIGKFEFNLSHSKDYAVLAVSDKTVGIDVEHIRKNRLSVAKRFFCKEEYEDILSVSEEEQDKRFLEYWTMKEAYVKYLGTGMSTAFDSFLIKRLENGISVVEKDNIYFATWFLEDTDYCISVCNRNLKELQNINICSTKK